MSDKRPAGVVSSGDHRWCGRFAVAGDSDEGAVQEFRLGQAAGVEWQDVTVAVVRCQGQ